MYMALMATNSACVGRFTGSYEEDGARNEDGACLWGSRNKIYTHSRGILLLIIV